MNAFAAETIKIAWPFGFGNYYASLLALAGNANKEQSKYNFIVELKQGASGNIAANYVDSHPANTLMLTSTTFVIKQLTTPGGTEILDKFVPIYVTQTNTPLVVVSKEFKTIDELLRKKDVNIGISAAGGISDIIAKQLLRGTTGQAIPHRGLVDAINAVAAGQVDAAMGTATDSIGFVEEGRLNVLGSTGTHGPKPFNQKQFPGIEKLATSFAMYSSVKMPLGKRQEIHQILSTAGLNDNVRNLIKPDYCTMPYFTYIQTQKWFDGERKYWESIVNNQP